MRKTSCFFKVSAVAMGLGLGTQVFAAGFQINELSPTIQATALADAATASGDISGMAFNPSTLASIQGSDIYVGGSLIMPEIGYNNASSTLATATTSPTPSPGSVASQSNISPTAFVPALYMGTSIPYHDALKIGLGVNAPFGLTTDYNNNWVGQFNALDSTVKTLNIFPTIAYQVNKDLSIGAAVNFERISANYSNNFYQVEGSPSLVEIEGSSILNGSAWGTGYSAGLTYKLSPTTIFGADYHSPVRESINGNALISSGCSGLFCPFVPASDIPNGNYNGNVVIKLPGSVNLGLSQKINNKLTLMAGAQWTEWSSIQGINVAVEGIGQNNSTLTYQNSWLYSLGGSYLVTPKLTLSGGVAYDETPTVNQYRDARIPDSSRQWLTFGAQYAATQNFSIFGTYEHIFMNDQSINSTEPGTGGPAAATVSADYSGYANIVAAGMNYSF